MFLPRRCQENPQKSPPKSSQALRLLMPSVAALQMQRVGRRGGCVHRRDLAALLRVVEWAGVAAAWCGWGLMEGKRRNRRCAPLRGAASNQGKKRSLDPRIFKEGGHGFPESRELHQERTCTSLVCLACGLAHRGCRG